MADGERTLSQDETCLYEGVTITTKPVSAPHVPSSHSDINPFNVMSNASVKPLEKRRKKFLEMVSAHISMHHSHRANELSEIFSRPKKAKKKGGHVTNSDFKYLNDRISIPGYADLILYQDPSHYPLLKVRAYERRNNMNI